MLNHATEKFGRFGHAVLFMVTAADGDLVFAAQALGAEAMRANHQ